MKHKPRLLKLDGKWICVDRFTHLENGSFLYRPLGDGATPNQAWKNALKFIDFMTMIDEYRMGKIHS
jgi:hypothetical protein